MRRIRAEDFDLALAARPVPLEYLDRGRLAGPVGSEESEHLPALDREIDALDGLEVPVGLAKASGRDDGRRDRLLR